MASYFSLVVAMFLTQPVLVIVGLFRPEWVVPFQPARRWQVLLIHLVVLPILWVVIGGHIADALGDEREADFLGLALGVCAVFLIVQAIRQMRGLTHCLMAKSDRLALEQKLANPSAGPVAGPVGHGVSPSGNLGIVLIDLQKTLAAEGLDRAAEQAKRLAHKYHTVIDILNAQLAPGEMTYGRYKSVIDGAVAAARDAFERSLQVKRGMRAIDEAYIRRRLDGQDGELSPGEREALQGRLALLDQGRERLAGLAADVEAVMTALDHSAMTWSDISTGPGHSAVGHEQALEDLRQYMDRARVFDVRQVDDLDAALKDKAGQSGG